MPFASCFRTVPLTHASGLSARASHPTLSLADHAIARNVDPMWSAWLLDRTSDYIQQSSGRFDDARALSERALAVTENGFGTIHALTASRLNNLGALLVRLGEYRSGRTLLEQSLQIYERLYGKEHAELARPYANLGAALYVEGDEQKASEPVWKAIELAPPDDEFLTVMFSNWAGFLVEAGGISADDCV